MDWLVYLRSFPLLFGMHWQYWHPQMVGTNRGTPQWDGDGQPDALSVFLEATFSDMWDDARMVEVVQYLKGNTHLRLPKVWQDAIPKCL